ncbi:MAG: hypothetical protein ACJAU6_001137 [Alphaproteobacteria bacterium]|jgi:hypothetical protein
MKYWRDNFYYVCAFALIPFFIGIYSIASNDFFSWEYWGANGDGKTVRSEVFRNFGLVAVALGALIVGSWRAYTANRQANLADRGHVTDRFAKAVEMLGAENSATVRTGAVYALGRVARDSIKQDHIPVMQVLCQFIRNSPYAEAQEEAIKAYEIVTERGDNLTENPIIQECSDTIAALEVISQRSEDQRIWEKTQGFVPSLNRARLPLMGLSKADFSHLEMEDADLRCSTLRGAILDGVNHPIQVKTAPRDLQHIAGHDGRASNLIRKPRIGGARKRQKHRRES